MTYSICLDPKLANAKKYSIVHRTQAAPSIINSFKGMMMEEMKESAKMNHINVNIYDYDKDKRLYDIKEQ